MNAYGNWNFRQKREKDSSLQNTFVKKPQQPRQFLQPLYKFIFAIDSYHFKIMYMHVLIGFKHYISLQMLHLIAFEGYQKSCFVRIYELCLQKFDKFLKLFFFYFGLLQHQNHWNFSKLACISLDISIRITKFSFIKITKRNVASILNEKK